MEYRWGTCKKRTRTIFPRYGPHTSSITSIWTVEINWKNIQVYREKWNQITAIVSLTFHARRHFG